MSVSELVSHDLIPVGRILDTLPEVHSENTLSAVLSDLLLLFYFIFLYFKNDTKNLEQNGHKTQNRDNCPCRGKRPATDSSTVS